MSGAGEGMQVETTLSQKGPIVWLVLVVGGGVASRPARTIVGSVLRRLILLLLFFSIVACGSNDGRWKNKERRGKETRR